MSSISKKGRPKGSKNKPKLINVGQQPNNPQIQEQFAGALNAKNVGVDKIILSLIKSFFKKKLAIIRKCKNIKSIIISK